MTDVPYVYIAGPISINPDGYLEHFKSAQRYLESIGIPPTHIFNPALYEAEIKFEDPMAAYRHYMEKDLSWICNHATDMYMLSGWEQSPGAQVEHALGRLLKLNFMYED